MTNPNIKLNTLISEDSILKLTTTKDIVEQKGAIAGVNGSFFSWLDTKGHGEAIGPIIESGNLINSNNWLNDKKPDFATFALTKDTTPLYNYWQTNM